LGNIYVISQVGHSSLNVTHITADGRCINKAFFLSWSNLW